ncbi:MAG: hypothetical protein ACW98U_02510 [Candidatus Thorarchaeota archaeon]
MISIIDDITTRLQALFHSGDIKSYIHSKLPEGPLKTGWLEKGLLSKGMKGQLRDKHNQESLIIPTDRFARLTKDMSGIGPVNIFILGSKGLSEKKFAAMIYEYEGSQSLIAFQIQTHTPLDIVGLLLQGFGKKMSSKLDDPNLDYVEQLRMDTAERIVSDALVLSLPKEIAKISEWIKATIQEKSSDNILLRHGNSKDLVVFSALLTRWINGLELFREMRSAIAACVFVKDKEMDVCFWDSSQKIASFATFTSVNIEELSRKYLLPLWMVPGDSLRPSPKKREVVVEPRTRKRGKDPSEKKESKLSVDVDDSIESMKRRLDSVSIPDLETRLESIETKMQTSPDSPELDKGTFDALQSRLSDNIDRIESLANRLGDLEKRIKKISSLR